MRFLAAVALAAAFACVGCGGKAKEKEENYGRSMEITVTGEAQVEAVVDVITVDLGVETIDKDVAAAQAANDRAVRALIAVIEKLGIPAKDVETGTVSLTRRESENRDGVRVFEGYLAGTEISVTLHDVSRYNPLITGALAAGVNRISNVDCGCTTEKAKRSEARVAAVRDARAKAEAMAAALGKKLGDPLEVSEEEPRGLSGSFSYSASSSSGVAAEDRPTLVVGRKFMDTSVRVRFELKD
jgi:uncharacterized protein